MSVAAGLTFSRNPPERSSSTRTSCPIVSRESTTWLPIKPAPPVTSEIIPCAVGNNGPRFDFCGSTEVFSNTSSVIRGFKDRPVPMLLQLLLYQELYRRKLQSA